MEYREELADLFACLGHEARLAILEGLDAGESMPAVSEDVGLQRGSLQSHLERVIECGLVFRPDDDRAYALTPLGEAVLESVASHESLGEALQQYQEQEKKVRQEFSDIPLSEREREQAIDRETWEQLTEEINSILDG